MSPLLILLIAVLIVVGGVLVLRLHAALALLAAAIIIGLLTPSEFVYQHEVLSVACRVVEVNADGGLVTLRSGRGKPIFGGLQSILRREPKTGLYEQIGQADLTFVKREKDRCQVRLQTSDDELSFAVDDAVLHYTLMRAAAATVDQPVGERVARGFGTTCGKIGILIALASIIGKCLLDSGAAERIVITIRSVLGDQRASPALVVSGFVMGIPVFFDTVFYLLIPLAKSLRARTGKNYLLYVMSIIVGATMAHSLVPPTPGPLFVAGELGVSVGLMMLGGLTVGSLAATAGYAYALWANRRWEIPLRDGDGSPAQTNSEEPCTDASRMPPFWASVLPIVLPVVLLGGKTIFDMAWADVPAEQTPNWLIQVRPILETIGEKNVALALATVLAMLLLVRAQGWREQATRSAVQDALTSGGLIVLITAAGGALGHVLRQTNIAAAVQDVVPAAGTGIALLVTAFTLTAVVRVAQGSATVAMITGAGIVAPIAAATALPYHPLYLALAIGCGSKPLPWMNDSGFWVVGRMSGMTPMETLKTFSAGLTVMGIAGFLAVMLGAWLFPLM
jgi:GntP family gluconate:H+ symporter